MDRKKALALKSIVYSKQFIEEFGDWISLRDRMLELPEEERTVIQEGIVALRFKVSIPLDDNYEPMLIPRVWGFIQKEYDRIFIRKEGGFEVYESQK